MYPASPPPTTCALSTPFWEFHEQHRAVSRAFRNLEVCFLLPFGSFSLLSFPMQHLALHTLSTPFWEFLAGFHSRTVYSVDGIAFYSLLGVSQYIKVVVSSIEGMELSTPFWEFHGVLEWIDLSGFGNHFLLPFGSFMRLMGGVGGGGAGGGAFYSLLGVSGFDSRLSPVQAI